MSRKGVTRAKQVNNIPEVKLTYNSKIRVSTFFFFILLSKEPRKIVLGRKRLNKKVGNKRRIVLTEEEFYYIPLIKTLEAQLLSKNIISMTLDGPQLSKVANTF